MGRPRSNYICPKCGKEGYLEKKSIKNKGSQNTKAKIYSYVVHYDSLTKKRKRCYVDPLLWDGENEALVGNLIKILKNMSPTEIQELAEQFLKSKSGLDRKKAKLVKESIEFVAIQRNIPLPRYQKTSKEIPPKHLQGPSPFYYKIKEISKTILDIHKYLEDIAKSVYQFPPDNETSEKCLKQLNIFDKGIVQTIKMLLVPYSDRRWSADWIKWIDIHLTKLEQSKKYAGSKHAIETGEYTVKVGNDGKEIILPLYRGITRKQIGNKEIKLFQMVQQMLIANPMLKALHDYTYNTSIHEEYDTDGNPI